MTNAGTREVVRRRAGNRCEYCLLPQQDSAFPHHIEHIVAKQHGGSSDPANLALACPFCNFRKGPNLAGIDPVTKAVAPLFHPRRDSWLDHFRVDGFRIEGVTPTGRATVNVLAFNDPDRLDLRAEIRWLPRSR